MTTCNKTIEDLNQKYGVDGISWIITSLIDRIKYPENKTPLTSEEIDEINKTSIDLRNSLVLCQSASEKGLLINEGGINWRWFTRIKLNPDGTVTILENYRRHLDETPYWTDEEKKAMSHTEYYGANIWKEEPGRVAIEYNIPGIGWRKITNPKYIGDYGKNK
jgi:hypothetical protein